MIPDVGWMEDAECLRYDPELWFSDGPGRPTKVAKLTPAQKVCRGCGVRLKCLDRALELEAGFPRDHRFGVLAAVGFHKPQQHPGGAVVRLVGRAPLEVGDESVERHGHVENRC